MESTLKYYTIDWKQDIQYPEQHYAVGYITPTSFLVSQAILDPTFLFDPAKNYNENVTAIAYKNFGRARYFRNDNDFLNAYAAGTRTIYDDYSTKGQAVPFLCFDTIIDFDQDLSDRKHPKNIATIAPVTVERRDIDLCGSYSFDNFTRKDQDSHSACCDEKRITKAIDFNEQIKAVPELYKLCAVNTAKRNAETGDLYAAAIGTIVRKAVFFSWMDTNIPLLTTAVPGHRRPEDGMYETLQNFTETKQCISCTRIGSPLSNPEAAYNVRQFARKADGKYPEGNNQAERAARHLSGLYDGFALPNNGSTAGKFRMGTTLVL